MVSKTMETFWRIDVLVNNAGICKETLISEKNKQTFHETWDTYIIGLYWISLYVRDIMKK